MFFVIRFVLFFIMFSKMGMIFVLEIGFRKVMY